MTEMACADTTYCVCTRLYVIYNINMFARARLSEHYAETDVPVAAVAIIAAIDGSGNFTAYPVASTHNPAFVAHSGVLRIVRGALGVVVFVVVVPAPFAYVA